MGELEAINLQSIITCQFFVIAIVFGGVVAARSVPAYLYKRPSTPIDAAPLTPMLHLALTLRHCVTT